VLETLDGLDLDLSRWSFDTALQFADPQRVSRRRS